MRASVYVYAFVFAMGALFGTGLMLAGMTGPANVQGFFDLAGDWRPQLLGVLGTGVVVTAALFAAGMWLGQRWR